MDVVSRESARLGFLCKGESRKREGCSSRKAYPFFCILGLFHGWSARKTERSIAHNARRGVASPPRAWSIGTGQCSAARTPSRAVRPLKFARSGSRALKQERVPHLSVPVTSQWHAQEDAGQPLRVHQLLCGTTEAELQTRGNDPTGPYPKHSSASQSTRERWVS